MCTTLTTGTYQAYVGTKLDLTVLMDGVLQNFRSVIYHHAARLAGLHTA